MTPGFDIAAGLDANPRAAALADDVSDDSSAADPKAAVTATVAWHSLRTSAIAIACTVVSGVVVARVLGASGRGFLAALTVLPIIAQWVFALGARQAISHLAARTPTQAPALVFTWLLVGVPLSMLGVAVTEFVLPFALREQPASTLAAARLFTPPMVIAGIYAEVAWGALLGSHSYRFFNLAQATPPVVVAVAYSSLAMAHALSMRTALIAFGSAYFVVAVFSLIQVVGRCRFQTPSWRLARESVVFGLKAHTMNVSSMVSARLDVAILPAYVLAAQVGLYSVATNVSWILVSLPATLAAIALPAATSAGSFGHHQLLTVLRLTVLVSLAGALIIGVVGADILQFVYGTSFTSAALPLRVLLVGSIAMSGTAVLNSGLCALGRPLRAGLTLLPALAITIVGLTLFLRSGGITVAALISTIAYCTSFVCALLLYRSSLSFPARELLPVRADFEVLLAPARLICRAPRGGKT